MTPNNYSSKDFRLHAMAKAGQLIRLWVEAQQGRQDGGVEQLPMIAGIFRKFPAKVFREGTTARFYAGVLEHYKEEPPTEEDEVKALQGLNDFHGRKAKLLNDLKKERDVVSSKTKEELKSLEDSKKVAAPSQQASSSRSSEKPAIFKQEIEHKGLRSRTKTINL